MRISFAGSHRVGKSTLAFKLAERSNSKFVASSVSKCGVWKLLNSSPSDDYTFAERIFIQRELINHMVGISTQNNGNFCTDRSFIDLVGYLYGSVDHTASTLLNDATSKIIVDCVMNQIRYYDKMIFIYPVISVKEDHEKIGKKYLSLPYIDSISNHIFATMVRYIPQDKYIIVPTELMTVDDRVNFILRELGK